MKEADTDVIYSLLVLAQINLQMGRKIANHSSNRSQGLKETHNTLKTLKVKLFGAKTL